MDTTTVAIIVAAFSSSAALVVALVNGWYSLRAKRNEHINDYHKTIVAKRLAAYEKLETLVAATKTCVLDVDRRPYHIIFASSDEGGGKLRAFETIANAVLPGNWLGSKSFAVAQQFNYLSFGLHSYAGSAIDFGKEHYEKIALLRVDLELAIASDLLDLYDVPKFLKARKAAVAAGFSEVHADRSGLHKA